MLLPLKAYRTADCPKIPRHSEYSKVIEVHPEAESFFAFSFVRNPWDRLLSWYSFKQNGRAHKKISPELSFKDFVLTSGEEQGSPYGRMLAVNQYDWVNNFTKNSFIGRFENLQADFDLVCDKIGIPRVQLPHRNKSKHNHYIEYYDHETREIVRERYARDVEYFGYKFGE